MASLPVNLLDLPSTIYRVSIKALIFDEQRRVLVLRNKHGFYELPGGGWEHVDASLEDGLRRELLEELGEAPEFISPIKCVFRGNGNHTSHVLRLVFEVRLPAGAKPRAMAADGMIALEFVTKEQFAALNFDLDDRNSPEIAHIIWP